MKRSTWASGSGYVPSDSIGFWVAMTRNGWGTSWVSPPIETCCGRWTARKRRTGAGRPEQARRDDGHHHVLDLSEQAGPVHLRRNFQRVLLWLLLSGVFWILGGTAEGQARTKVNAAEGGRLHERRVGDRALEAAQQAGMKMLANLAKEGIPFVHQGLTTTGKFLRERRAQVKAFVRGYGRAVHFMHTRKEESKLIVSRYTKVTDPAMLEGTLQYAYDFVEKIPLVKREAFQVTADEIGKKNPKAKAAKLEQFYDNSLVQELINEGFFTSLWGK